MSRGRGCHADSRAGLPSVPRLLEGAAAPSEIIASRLWALQLGHLTVRAALNLSLIPSLFYPFPRSLPQCTFSYSPDNRRAAEPPPAVTTALPLPLPPLERCRVLRS